MRTNLSAEMALQKARAWCAYQERSQDETRRKLMGMGLKGDELEELIASLISENFLNEERFAIALASGKFRIKRWGRIKIKAELRRHKISDFCITKALRSIDEAEYLNAITGLIEKKDKTLVKKDNKKQYYALHNYLVSRGFESDLVSEKLNEHIKNIND